MPTYDPETREWVVVDQATGEAKRFAESDYASAIAYSRQVNPPAEADVAVDQPSVAFRTAHRREYDQLQTWNQQQKEAGGIQLSEADAQQAMGYMDSLGLSFFQSLNLYSQYIGSKQNVPGPSEVEGPVVITPAEINHLRGIAGAPPFAVSPVAGESFFQTNAPTAAAPTTAPPQVLTAEQQKWWDRAIQVAQEKGLPDPGAFARLLLWESKLSPTAGNESGAYGIAQFMPDTARAYGLDPSNPDASIQAAAQLLLDNYNSLQARFGTTDWDQAYAAYFYGATGIGDIIEANGANWKQAIAPKPGEPDYLGELNFVTGGVTRGGGTAAAAPGGAPGATGGYIPSTEDTWGKLNRAQQQAYYDLYAPRGMPMDYYVAAIMRGQDPTTYWEDRKLIELNQALEDGEITGAEFNVAHAFRMSGGECAECKQLGVPIATCGQVFRAGGTMGEVREAVARGIDPLAYHQYSQTLSEQDFATAELMNIPLNKMVEQKQLALAEKQATDEFNQAWATQYSDLPAQIGMDSDINAYMNYRQEQLRQDYVTERIVGLNKAAKAGTLESAVQQNPYAKNQETGLPAPTPALPDVFSLIEQGVREGVIAQYVPGREPVPGGRAEQPRSVARTARGGPPQVGGIPTGQEGGFLGFTTGGDIAAQQALARAYMAKPSVIPEGYTEDQWQAVLRARYPGAAPEEPLEEPESDLERLNRGTKLQKAKKRRPLAITG